MSHSKTNARQGSFALPIAIMFALFFMIAFVTGYQNPLGDVIKQMSAGNAVMSQLGTFCNFIAYAIMGYPAGKILQNKGYRVTALGAVSVGFIGVAITYVSGMIADTNVALGVYMLGALVAGFSMCMLNTVVNPMLNLLGGGGNKGNQLVQTGGSLNSLAATCTPLFVGMLIGEVTASTTMEAVAPLLFLAMGIFVLAFIVISAVSIPEPHMRKGGMAKTNHTHSPWSFRHTVLGVIGIFLYVGIEVGIPGVLIFYLTDVTGSVAVAGGVAAIYWLLMLVGRLVSSIISGKVSSRAQLITVSVAGIALVCAAIFLSESITVSMPAYSASEGFSTAQVPAKAMLLVLCGLCTSVMWGGIFNLAVEGLGKYTAKASGIFMMMVVGGGVLPLIQNAIANNIGYMASYWLVVAVFCYMLYYGLVGSRNVNTDIPVDDEVENAG